jgi:hypothetical protein
MIRINGTEGFVKHIGDYFALLVDEHEREYKIPVEALKNASPAFRRKRSKRVK